MKTTKKVIVAFDDSRLVLDAVKAALSAQGFEVRCAGNVKELDAVLARGEPDFFVLDVQTPEVYGDSVGEVLRSVRRCTAPVILFSSVDASELAARVKAAGLDGFVSKDDGVDALVARVVALLGA